VLWQRLHLCSGPLGGSRELMAPSGPGLTKIRDFLARTDTIRLRDGTKLAFWTWPDSFAREFRRPQIPRDFKLQFCIWHAISEVSTTHRSQLQ
jgi:hypothetical protein